MMEVFNVSHSGLTFTRGGDRNGNWNKIYELEKNAARLIHSGKLARLLERRGQTEEELVAQINKQATEEGEYEDRPKNKYKKALAYGAGAVALGGTLAYGSHKINQNAQVGGFAQKHLGSLGRGISDLRYGNKPREGISEVAGIVNDSNMPQSIRNTASEVMSRVGKKEGKKALSNYNQKQASITSILSSLAGKSQSIKNWASNINQAVGTDHFSENVLKGNYAHAIAQGLRDGEFPDHIKTQAEPAIHNLVRAEVIRDNSTSAAKNIKGIYNSTAPLAKAKYDQIAPHLKTIATYLNSYLSGKS